MQTTGQRLAGFGEEGGAVPRKWWYGAVDGNWDVKYFDTLTAGTSQSFEVRRDSDSSRIWKWYAGGDLKEVSVASNARRNSRRSARTLLTPVTIRTRATGGI